MEKLYSVRSIIDDNSGADLKRRRLTIRARRAPTLAEILCRVYPYIELLDIRSRQDQDCNLFPYAEFKLRCSLYRTREEAGPGITSRRHHASGLFAYSAWSSEMHLLDECPRNRKFSPPPLHLLESGTNQFANPYFLVSARQVDPQISVISEIFSLSHTMGIIRIWE